MKRKIVIALAIITIILTGIIGRQLIFLSKFTVVLPKRGDLSTFIVASGKTKVDRIANLSFKTTGRIIYLVGQQQAVKEGEMVASLDRQSLLKQRESSLKDYYVERMDFEQLMDDYGSTIDNDTEKRAREKEQAKLDKSVIAVELVQQQINESALYSPFAGVVLEVNGERNEWTSAFTNTPLLVIVDPASVYFEAQIKEEDVENVKIGDKVELTFYAFPGRKFTGELVEIDKQMVEDEYGENVMLVKVAFEPEKELPKLIDLIGLEGDIKIEREAKDNVLLLPKRAVILEKQQPHVLTKKGIFVDKKPVKLGIAGLDKVEVKEGISEEDRILLPKILP